MCLIYTQTHIQMHPQIYTQINTQTNMYKNTFTHNHISSLIVICLILINTYDIYIYIYIYVYGNMYFLRGRDTIVWFTCKRYEKMLFFKTQKIFTNKYSINNIPYFYIICCNL